MRFTLISMTLIAGLAACGDPAENAAELSSLAASEDAWEAAKVEHGNSYRYVRRYVSFSGSRSRTEIVVAAGVVTERHHERTGGDGEPVEYSELGAEVGSHSDGFPPVLLDALYDECRSEVLVQDPATNSITFRTDERGLLQACTYTPNLCQDDCTFGPEIDELVF